MILEAKIQGKITPAEFHDKHLRKTNDIRDQK